MINKILEVFTCCATNQCHQVLQDVLFNIIEPQNDTGKCYVDIINTTPNFVVNNPNSQEIYFLAIDGCIISDNTKRCDCILFNSNEFSFIEIKGTNNRGKFRQHSINAYKQLETTIELFQKHIDFEGYKLEAIVAFKLKPPVPAASTNSQNQALKFLKNYGVKLKKGNEKTYS